MLLPDIEARLNGCPGAVVDEGFTDENKLCLYYFCYNDDGRLIVFEIYPRNVSPEYIAECLDRQAEDILENPPDSISPENAVVLVEELREQAKKVPGLRE
jgi:hypothetical protein